MMSTSQALESNVNEKAASVRRRPFSSLIAITITLLQIGYCSPFPAKTRQYKRPEPTTKLGSVERDSLALSPQNQGGRDIPTDDDWTGRLLIHWKGEAEDGYSMQFRHIEFKGALSAVMNRTDFGLEFENALSYRGTAEMKDVKLLRYFNEAMQFVSMDLPISSDAFYQAAERCSLVHALYRVVSEGETYDELGREAIANRGFADMMPGGGNEKDSWCLRVRHYGEGDKTEEMRDLPKQVRYNHRARSMKREREGLNALKPLLLQFGGRVDLKQPDCKIYIFDGLTGNKKVLARRQAVGPQISVINPNTRICVTNTPLCPIAAFSLCNVASIQRAQNVLDPYAGSCATLLAAAMIEPTCRTVAIEIAHDGLVNRDDIRSDFSSRGLTPPLALIQGDCIDPDIRDKARDAIGEGSTFDAIVTDPPYGIRESTNYNALPPLTELFAAIAWDRKHQKRLLKLGGRLVAFVPVEEDQLLQDCLPAVSASNEAGLKCELVREQPLNDRLSRWLVSYRCVE